DSSVASPFSPCPSYRIPLQMLRTSVMDSHSNMGRVDWMDSVPYDDNRSMSEMGRGAYTDCFSYSSSGHSGTFSSDPIWSPSALIEDPFLRPSTILSTLPTPLLHNPPSPKPLSSWSVKKGPGAPSLNHLMGTTEPQEMFARKVFVGGLPIDVSEAEISSTFSHFGSVLVDWPRRPDTARDAVNGSRHMTGYVFLVFEEERSVQALVKECHHENGRYYLFVSSPTMRDKPVQVRPWRLSDMDYMVVPSMMMDPRRTVFIGGVPRPTKAKELADVLEELYGSVCYVGIDIDPELKYPKGAARVTFTTTRAFVAAIHGRFVQIPHAETKKRVEIKPYVMDDQMCDECFGKSCSSRYAPYFCGDVSCLQYYCETCWDSMHLAGPLAHKRANHRPLIRQGDQTKLLARPSHHQAPRSATASIRPLRLY
ncbi:hypothetical protein PFISCL1PPCAC_8086, partial [Pristionchus fissidentatus]